ncbi:hypothetical protein BJ170DRAFT_268594 [Xylariales sp. AK1849]|nr:hypothetical protein BJ170DRAFT_268594 [Xylariales sp. AK1849]
MATKTVAFFGASQGVGLSALQHSLTAGYECIALCRDPSKLTTILPTETTPNLEVRQGNVHDTAAVSRCLKTSQGRFVDEIVFTVGSKPVLSKLTVEDPTVCGKGITSVLGAIAELRQQGITGRPHVVVCSSTGLSRFGRDVPLAMVPLYHVMLKLPHEDKQAMEANLIASGEEFSIVRMSLLVNGGTKKAIRVGIEDPKTGLESKAVGYTISREDAGKWIARNLVIERGANYLNKIATITY